MHGSRFWAAISCAQVLLDRHGVVSAALDRGVVRHDHALAPAHPADAADDGPGMHVAAVHAPRRKLADLEKGRSRVEELRDALARQHLAARGVLVARSLVAALRDDRDLLLQVLHQRAHARRCRGTPPSAA